MFVDAIYYIHARLISAQNGIKFDGEIRKINEETG